jgi:putative tricarboxylic transport membrane protein
VAFADERYEDEPLSSVPTAKEEGVDVSFTQFRGALAPGGVAPEERQYWADALVAWTETQNYKKYIADNYLMSKIRTGQQFESYLGEQEQMLQEGVFGNQGG